MHAPREHRGFEIGRQTGSRGRHLWIVLLSCTTIEVDVGDIHIYTGVRLGAFPQASTAP